jgi:hydrogenase nickel incorporation protein HypB
MFSKVDVLLVNKIDTLSMFDFDLQAVRERVTRLNPTIRIIPISAKTGQGVAEWAGWLREAVAQWKND